MGSTRSIEFWLCYRPFGDQCEAVLMVDEARAAVVRDTAERAIEAGFGRVRVFSTVALGGLEVERTRADQTVGDVVAAAAASVDAAVCYAGSGMPAMTSADWTEVREMIESGDAVSNRMFSCDWLAAPTGRWFSDVAGEAVDNRFARRIRDERGVEIRPFERSARSLLDLDTPADLAVLAACAAVGSLPIGVHLQAVLDRWAELLAPTVAGAIRVFETMTRRDETLLVAGRVSGADWAVVDRDTSCRIRVLSEERGLGTREGRGRSLLASLYDAAGAGSFVTRLSELTDSMLWDVRPFCSHLGWDVGRADRFWADLGRWDAVSAQPLADLVRRLAPQRVLIGGHSLVAGGMLAGIDQAWTRLEMEQTLSG